MTFARGKHLFIVSGGLIAEEVNQQLYSHQPTKDLNPVWHYPIITNPKMSLQDD